MKSPIRPHPHIQLNVLALGNEQSPFIVIDNFISNANEIAEDAGKDFPFCGFGPKFYYPGVHAPIPPAYPVALFQIMLEPIRQIFGFQGKGVVDVQSDYRMVTQPPDGLHPRQRVPHYDGAASNVVVILHYLMTNPSGGTSIYRHRKTGYEIITPDRAQNFEETLTSEMQDYIPSQFDIADSPLFEKLVSIPAQFNRAIVYRGACLHSGDIAPDFPFDPNPATGRLTASTFFTFGMPTQPLSPSVVRVVS